MCKFESDEASRAVQLAFPTKVTLDASDAYGVQVRALGELARQLFGEYDAIDVSVGTFKSTDEDMMNMIADSYDHAPEVLYKKGKTKKPANCFISVFSVDSD